MKIRFIIIFLAAMALILFTSIVASYTIITQTQKNFEKELETIKSLSENNPEIQKRISIYRAFSEKQAVDITRMVLTISMVEIVIMSVLFLFLIYGMTKPINRLSDQVKSIYFDKNEKELILNETGTEEIRILIRAFNEMILKLKNYETILGNIQKYRGWKEISRIIVHEINNIISPIQTYIEFLIDKVEEKDKILFILNKLNDIKMILQKFREISRFPDANLERRNVVPLIEEVCKEFKNVRLKNGVERFYLKVDTVLFKEVIRNLVKNGVESGKNTRVEINLQKKENCKVINVKDNGSGISRENLKKIFEPGFSTKKGSLGIGLSIVQSLAQEQNAVIKVESKINHGTNFKLIFSE